MARLTPKQESFVRFYIETGNASEAYRRAYNASRMSDNAIHVAACRLLQNSKVALRVSELRGKAAEKVVLDKAWVLDRLMRNARVCLGEEMVKLRRAVKDDVVEVEVHLHDAGAANRALELLGKELAMFVDRKEVGKPGDFTDLTDEQLAHIARRGGNGIAAQTNGAAQPDRLH